MRHRPEEEFCGATVDEAIESLQEDLMDFQAVVTKQKRRIAQLESAVRWALGENGEFPDEPAPLAGKYRRRFWWRTELRKRAKLPDNAVQP